MKFHVPSKQKVDDFSSRSSRYSYELFNELMQNNGSSYVDNAAAEGLAEHKRFDYKIWRLAGLYMQIII